MKRVCFAAVLTILVCLGAAHADEIPLDFVIAAGGDITVLDRSLSLNPDNSFGDNGALEGEGYDIQWEVDGNIDPSITVALAVNNLSSVDQTFLFSFLLPVAAILPPTVTGGSFGGSLTDGNGDGATLSDSAGNPIYTAQVNAASFHTLGDGPYTFLNAVPFTTASIPVESFGVPGLTEPGPGVIVNSMGLLLGFRLSAHDSVSFTANFILEPRAEVIPEPATMSLIGLGLIGFAGRSLRRMRRN